MRYQWHKKLDREILLPRKSDDVDRKETKIIDIQLRKKEECHDTQLGGECFKDFGDEIPPRAIPTTETNPDTITTKSAAHTESTASSSPEEPVTIQEPGAYPAIPVQEYRDGPIEEYAVHYVRINRIIESKAVRNRQQENVRSAELGFMLDLETLIKEMATDPYLMKLKCCLEDYKQVAKRLTHRCGITMVENRIIVSK